MPIIAYLTLEGAEQGEMKGDCQQKGNKLDTIPVFGMEHLFEIPRDTHTGLPVGQVIHHPLIIIKKLDLASPLIARACCTGEKLSKFQLDFYAINEKGKEELYYQIILSGEGNNLPIIVSVEDYFPLTFLPESKPYYHMEKVSFTYPKISWEHKIAGKMGEYDWMADQTA